ncbi:hypothetical protein EX895_003053 [Sporisorium graminicola]|uniref:Uncharacterized protein n=1 Tax=Sporisorium graminicola TaxID=280036 RepID=A0A4U7KUZ4_9BASI|nr:hypothetical protein EX895_003053 [Sporisorium graminicola]TKY87957.1 hypothetical protein EX895_003053 [Sporisorium graminicola]
MCPSKAIFFVFSVALFFGIQPTSSAAAFRGTNLFWEPFHLSRSSDHRAIYSGRLHLHLFRDVDLEHFRVEEADESSPLPLRELQNQLRYEKTLRRFLHLGPAEGNRPGFVVGFPLAPEIGYEHRVTFALLAAHPLVNNFPVFTLHGLAHVTDFEKNDIEELLAQVPPPFDHAVGAGDVLSMVEVYDEALGLHAL